MESERIPISEWGQQATYSSHTTPSFIAPTVSECRSDIDYYFAPAQPAADDKQQRPNDTSAAACPVANTPRSTTNSTNNDDDDDEEDSDEEIGAMIDICI